MDSRKTTGLTDLVANLATEDEELHSAALQLKEKREREAKHQPSPEVPQKGDRPKSVPPLKKSETNRSNTKDASAKKRTNQSATQHRWSNPTSVLNTRIPPEMDQLLDDHVAKQKRQWKLERQQGKKPTKQTVVQAALEGYFKSIKS